MKSSRASFQNKEFTCPYCREDDELGYSSSEDLIVCRRCKIRISRMDAISGVPLWVTKDWRVIPVNQMETSHIQRCLGYMVVRGGAWRGHMLVPLVEELERRERTNKSD